MRLEFPVCQVTLEVTSGFVPPAAALAVKQLGGTAVELTANEMELGLTTMLVTSPRLTVAVVVPVAVPDAAVIVAVPTAIPFSRPPVVIVATLESELDQHTVVPEQLVPPVRATEFPLLSIPAAFNCSLAPWLTFGFGGLIVMLEMVGCWKKPVQLTPTTEIASRARAVLRRSLSFLDNIFLNASLAP